MIALIMLLRIYYALTDMLYAFTDALSQYSASRVGSSRLERTNLDFTNKSWAEPIATQTQITGPTGPDHSLSPRHRELEQQQTPPDPRA
jgi:hypothetical protein